MSNNIYQRNERRGLLSNKLTSRRKADELLNTDDSVANAFFAFDVHNVDDEVSEGIQLAETKNSSDNGYISESEDEDDVDDDDDLLLGMDGDAPLEKEIITHKRATFLLDINVLSFMVILVFLLSAFLTNYMYPSALKISETNFPTILPSSFPSNRPSSLPSQKGKTTKAPSVPQPKRTNAPR